MSMDQKPRDPNEPITEQEGVMFAAQPIWERNRKRRGFGGRKGAAAPAPSISPEPRTFASERDYEEPMALDTPVDRSFERPLASDYSQTEYADLGPASPTNSTLAAEEDTGMVAPIAHASTKRNDRRSRSMAPAAIAAGVVALGALGALGWFATRDNGVPELQPGSPTVTEEVATAPVTPDPPMPTAAPPAEVAATPPVNPAPARAQAPRAETRMAARSANRVRPAAAASASESGLDASTPATLPAGPQPYTTLNPNAPPAPVNPTPPTQAAPPPSEAPAAVPTTPPTLPQETQPESPPQSPPPSV